MIREENKSGDSSLRDWFTKSRASDGTPGWVQLGGKYAGKPCARQPGQTTKPKCGSSKMKGNLSDDEEQKAFERKNREDPNPDRKGKAKNVATEEKQELRYCPKCKKAEKRSDCAYGTSYWDKHAQPITVESSNILSDEIVVSDEAYKPWDFGPKQKAKKKFETLANRKKEEVKSGIKGGKGTATRANKIRKVGVEMRKTIDKDAEESGTDPKRYGLQPSTARHTDAAHRRSKRGMPSSMTLKYYGEESVVEGKGEKDACYHKVKSRYKVWPSAYASGALVKCRKKGADNWGTKSEEYQFSNWREDFKASEFEFIDLIKPEPLVSESCCSKCGKESCECGTKRYRGGSAAKPGPDKNYVKPMGEEIEEAVRIPAKTGNIVLVNLTWRGKYYGIKVFFPHTKVPSRKEVQTEIEKVYPGARVYNFQVSDYEPGQPLLQVSEGAAWTRKEGQSKEGGLNEKGRKSYERENPGSDLKAPSKEVGNKRRASFCARMKGMKSKLTSAKTANDPDSRINKSLRAWNC